MKENWNKNWIAVFDSHILLLDKNSLLWIIQYCPFLVSVLRTWINTCLCLYTFKVIRCRKRMQCQRLWTSYLELKLNAYKQMANALLFVIMHISSYEIESCHLLMTRHITNMAEEQTSEPRNDGWELSNVLPLPMKAWTSAVVSTNCLKVPFLIVLIKMLWMKYIYIAHLWQVFHNSKFGIFELLV